MRIPPPCWAAAGPIGGPRATQTSVNVKNRLTINIPFPNPVASPPNLSVFPATGNDHRWIGGLRHKSPSDRCRNSRHFPRSNFQVSLGRLTSPPVDYDEVGRIFSRRGTYRRYKDLLVQRDASNGGTTSRANPRWRLCGSGARRTGSTSAGPDVTLSLSTGGLDERIRPSRCSVVH